MERDFYAEYYEIEDRHWWFLGRRAIFTRVLDRRLGPSDDRRILDVGCGTGTMVRELARYGRVEGVDADHEAVAFCRERGLRNVRQVDGGAALPFESGSFALVTALDVIEHVDDDDAMLRELARVLIPGGLLLVSVPAYRFLWGAQDEIAHHKRRYVRHDLRARLEGAALAVERLSYFNTLLFPPIAAIRLLRPPARRGPRSDFALTRPGRVNDLLTRVMSAEAPLVERFDLPFGVSILGLARR